MWKRKGEEVIFLNLSKKRRNKEYERQLEQLIETEYAKMYRICLSYTHSQEDALDVIQDSFQKALLSFNRMEKIENFDAWFFRILVRTAIDSWRQKKRMPCSAAHEEWCYLGFIQLDERISYLELRDILEQTPSPEREIIVLKFFEGFTIREIATILDLNENTVKTKMYRSLDTFRSILE